MIGDRPPKNALSKPWLKYLGYLHKNIDVELRELLSWLAQAKAIVHPTTADTNPMVILEAAYHGCPAIASRLFAIPELIRDNETGILLDDPSSVTEISQKLSELLSMNWESYLSMREAAWKYSRMKFSPEVFKATFTKLLGETAHSSS